MPRLLCALCLTVAALGAGAVTAHAAPPWSEPQQIAGAFELVAPAAGRDPMLLGLSQALPDPRVRRIVGVPVVRGVAGPARESRSPFNVTIARVYGGDGIVAGVDLPSSAARPPDVALVRGRIGGPLQRSRSLRGRSRSQRLLDLAANEAGDAVAAVRWCHTAGCGRQSLQLFRWRAGARLGRPLRIARGRAFGAGVAINARGDVALIWDRRKRGRGGGRDVYGQVVTRRGRVRPRRRIADAPTAPRYRVAVTSTLRVVAAWVAQEINECFAHPGEIAVAQAGPGGRFTRARRLARLRISGCGRYASDPAVAFVRAPDGRVVIAWSGNEGQRWVVRAGELGASGVTGAAVVSDRTSDAVLADLAVGPRGEALLLLAQGIGGADASGPVRLLAVASSGAAFGAPELIAETAGVGSSAGFDPATAQPVVAYPSLMPDFSPATSLVTRPPL
jgi:predicted Rdx family selenoprotein